MVTVEEVKRAYKVTQTKPHIGAYIDSGKMMAHPLAAIMLSRSLPVVKVYEYFGPKFVDDFNIGFYDLPVTLSYDHDPLEFGTKLRGLVLDGSLVGE